jgi:hypothetical protein
MGLDFHEGCAQKKAVHWMSGRLSGDVYARSGDGGLDFVVVRFRAK